MDNIKHERDISPMQGAYCSKTIQNKYNTIQNSTTSNTIIY